MNGIRSRLMLVCGFIVLVPQLGLAAPVQWEQNCHSYEVIVVESGGISWPDAQAAAVARGGHLATLTSLDELEFVFNLTIDTPGAWISSAKWAIGPWLGGFDAGSDTWEWVTGEPYEEIHHPDYPDPDDQDLNCTHEVNGDYLIFWGCTPRPVCNGASGSYHSYVIEYDLAVLIGGPSRVVIANTERLDRRVPRTSTPMVHLYAIGQPSGGKYTWEIIDGKEKVELRGNVNQKSISVLPKEPSEEPEDVVIRVTYTYESRTCSKDRKLTIQQPTTLEEIEHHTDETSWFFTFHYVTTYRYRRLDQFGGELEGPYSTTEVVEYVSAYPNWYFDGWNEKYWKDDVIKTVNCSANSICELWDELSPPRRGRRGPFGFLAEPLPLDLHIIRKQYIYIQGWLVDTRRLDYWRGSATSTEWMEP